MLFDISPDRRLDCLSCLNVGIRKDVILAALEGFEAYLDLLLTTIVNKS